MQKRASMPSCFFLLPGAVLLVGLLACTPAFAAFQDVNWGARPVALEDGVLQLAFGSADAFQKSLADQDRNREPLAAVLANVFGARLRVRMETVDVAEPDVEPAAEPEDDEQEDPFAREEAFVSRLISDFGATDFDEPEEGS